MHIKNIRKIINKQLKTNHPYWKSMTRKSKKALAQEIVDEVVKNYDYSQTLDLPIEQLTGIDNQSPSGGIRSLPEMANYIDNFHSDNLFDTGLHFRQVMNVFVYILHYFYKSGCLENTVIHGIDSTELPAEVNYPLCTVKIKNQKIRVYSDLDCDCGQRRNKRDKSHYVIGYRLHTLTAINPSTGHSFPLVSVVAAANHHDSLFLKPLIKLAQALGIDIKLITADQAYHDKDGSVLEETGVYVVAPPSENVDIPDNVMESPIRVTCHDACDIPMRALGSTKEGHTLKGRN